MKIRAVTVFVLFLGVVNCAVFSNVKKETEVQKFHTVQSCKGLPPAEQFMCIPGLLDRSDKIFNDGGRILEFEKVDSDAYCSRYKMLYEIGSLELPPEQRIKRELEFSTCSGSVWGQLKSAGTVGVISFTVGYISGFLSALGLLK